MLNRKHIVNVFHISKINTNCTMSKRFPVQLFTFYSKAKLIKIVEELKSFHNVSTTPHSGSVML